MISIVALRLRRPCRGRSRFGIHAKIGVALLAWAALPGEAAALDVTTIARLWQFPEREVWIRIDADGTAFQCRIASRSPLTAITSKGIFRPPEHIVWEQYWGTERIVHERGMLIVHSKLGPFEYVPAAHPMAPECK